MNATQLFLGDPAYWKAVQVYLSAMQALFGGWNVYVFGDREAIVQRVSPITQEKRFRVTLTEAGFRSLLDTAIANDLLTIQPPSRPGHPDEPMIQITLVNSQKESRMVSKWAGDKHEKFDAVSRLLFELTTRTQNLTPYHSGPYDWKVSPIEAHREE
jgi:hypothetical protein